MSISLPRSGCAALVFYRNHSTAAIANVMTELLRERMVVLDIGAHIGEYTLIAAKSVGVHGQVHAFEPQPDLADVIVRNAKLNSLDNVIVHSYAVSDVDGTVAFCADRKSMGGFVVDASGGHANLVVPSVKLDTFVQQRSFPNVHLVKIDAAGNEVAVLRGGVSLFTAGCAPIVVCKFYHPAVVGERFDYDAREIVKTLLAWDYQLCVLTDSRRRAVKSPEDAVMSLGNAYCVCLLGMRNLAWRGLSGV